MYITNENQEYLERLFNGLDHSHAHDFMELLMLECSRKTGNSEYIVYARDDKEISDLAIPADHIITKAMIDDAYRKVTAVWYVGDEDE